MIRAPPSAPAGANPALTSTTEQMSILAQQVDAPRYRSMSMGQRQQILRSGEAKDRQLLVWEQWGATSSKVEGQLSPQDRSMHRSCARYRSPNRQSIARAEAGTHKSQRTDPTSLCSWRAGAAHCHEAAL